MKFQNSKNNTKDQQRNKSLWKKTKIRIRVMKINKQETMKTVTKVHRLKVGSLISIRIVNRLSM